MNPLASIPRGWWSFELPGYRPHPAPATYSLFPCETLPPIAEPLDDRFAWLKAAGIQRHSLADRAYGKEEKPALGILSEFIAQLGLTLPDSFITFMQSPALQQRIRSCTDSFLDLPDFPVKTTGVFEGHLIHFMADSQMTMRWYLYVGAGGTHGVVSSDCAFGFDYDEEYADKLEIDLQQERVWYCAASFNEFIYRFWIENEIYFALGQKRPLTPEQQAYVNHYK